MIKPVNCAESSSFLPASERLEVIAYQSTERLLNMTDDDLGD